jgi:hypothetical protein
MKLPLLDIIWQEVTNNLQDLTIAKTPFAKPDVVRQSDDKGGILLKTRER